MATKLPKKKQGPKRKRKFFCIAFAACGRVDSYHCWQLATFVYVCVCVCNARRQIYLCTFHFT